MLPVQRTLQSDDVAIHAQETLVGEIVVGMYETLRLFFDYTKGDEDGVYVRARLKGDSAWNECPLGTWTDSGGTLTFGASRWYMSSSDGASVLLDVRGLDVVRVYEQANGGAPSGKLGVRYTLQ